MRTYFSSGLAHWIPEKMAKASLSLPDGTAVTIEGSSDEVAALLHRFTGKGATRTKSKSSRRDTVSLGSTRDSKFKTTGPIDYVRQLVSAGFFSKKRAIGDVRDKLEEAGHIYPATSISPALIRLVRSRELRRIKENKQWRYVNP
jgi:hypothetical protein